MNKKILGALTVLLITTVLLSSVAAFSFLSWLGFSKDNEDKGSTIDNSLKENNLLGDVALYNVFKKDETFLKDKIKIENNIYAGVITLHTPSVSKTRIYKEKENTYVEIPTTDNSAYGVFYFFKDYGFDVKVGAKNLIFLKKLKIKVSSLTDALYWTKYINDLGQGDKKHIHIVFSTNNCNKEEQTCEIDINSKDQFIYVSIEDYTLYTNLK